MKKLIFFIFAISTLAFATCPKSCKNGCANYEIATASKSGTYYAFGKDIASYIAPKACINLKVIETKGSIDNIRKLKSKNYPRVKFAIVQSDVLQFYKKLLNSKIPRDRKEAKEILNKIRVIAPLYNEELHFLVNADSKLKTFSDLKNKRIVIGEPNSGTAMTAFILYKELFGEDLKYPIIQDFFSGLDSLGTKKADAILIVAGQPVKKLETKNKEASKLFRLLEYSEKDGNNINSYYLSTIKASSYSWLKEDIQTLSVKSYLITYNYSKKYTQTNLYNFIKAFKDNFDYLKKIASNDKNTPHPKWKEVKNICNFEHLPGGWKYYSILKSVCSNSTIDNNNAIPCTPQRRVYDSKCQ